ncbi:MAG: DUF5723 family protein [Chitinophagales bacterium]|nr:DUF5723 family protein [Chitinophagales bacterium]
MKQNRLLLILFLLFLGFAAKAQNYLGYVNSNYSGVNGVFLQPASIVDSRFKVDINLIGFQNTFSNNYVTFYRDRLIDYNSDLDFQDNYTYIDTFGTDQKYVYLNNMVQLPSISFNINRKNALAFTVRSRTHVNLDNVDPALARLAWEGLDYPPLWRTQLNNEAFSAQFMSWLEYGITYGREIFQIKNHYLKAGVSLKLLQGLGSAFMYADNLNYNFTNDDTLSIFQTQVRYGHSNNFEFDDAADRIKYKFEASPTVGFDMGVVYEWRKDESEYTYDLDGETGLSRRDLNKYKLKVGFSLLDIGNLKFTKGDQSADFVADIRNWDISDFDIESVSDLNDTIASRFGFTPTDDREYHMNLPTSISLQVDYNLWKGFYVNGTAFVSFKQKNDADKLRSQSVFSITPRFEHRWFDFGLPLSYTTDKEFRMGVGLRLGVLVIGTDDLISFAKKEVQRNDFYVALKIPVPFGKPKDKDKDGVSNKKDKCPKDPGIWAFEGCPDSDGDGLQDNVDKCPKEAGDKANDGCPWPDRDSDGVLDNVDECKDIAGPADNKGCPYGDKDKDGVLDNADQCIDVAGPAANNGCPYGDKDKDGVLDNADQCIDVPGPAENNGCPFGDKDGDGTLDQADKCIDTPGPRDNGGCPYPDSDGDGVLDKDDDCPKTPGPASNKGCPELERAEQEVIKTAFDNLEFETGKAIIKISSYESLGELAKMLRTKEGAKLVIAGHTDNVGSDALNLKLSQQRAEAVKKALMDRGVDGKKLIVEYYGETKPIASNDTAEGRQKNRRVEMKVIFE